MTDEIVWTGLKVIAARVGCGHATLRAWINDKDFPAFKLDGTWRALPVEVAAWLRAQRLAGLQGHGVRRTGGLRMPQAGGES